MQNGQNCELDSSPLGAKEMPTVSFYNLILKKSYDVYEFSKLHAEIARGTSSIGKQYECPYIWTDKHVEHHKTVSLAQWSVRTKLQMITMLLKSRDMAYLRSYALTEFQKTSAHSLFGKILAVVAIMCSVAS